MLLVLCVFSQWNRTLKREATRRTEGLILSRNELQTTFDCLTHALAFSTAQKVLHYEQKDIIEHRMLRSFPSSSDVLVEVDDNPVIVQPAVTGGL